jgi:hypothetical protein
MTLFVDSREREGGQAGANGRALNDKSDWKANEQDQRAGASDNRTFENRVEFGDR